MIGCARIGSLARSRGRRRRPKAPRSVPPAPSASALRCDRRAAAISEMGGTTIGRAFSSTSVSDSGTARGSTCSQAARRVFPSVPAALVTASNERDIINRAAFSRHRFSRKPFGPTEIAAFLERVTRRRGRHRRTPRRTPLGPRPPLGPCSEGERDPRLADRRPDPRELSAAKWIDAPGLARPRRAPPQEGRRVPEPTTSSPPCCAMRLERSRAGALDPRAPGPRRCASSMDSA